LCSADKEALARLFDPGRLGQADSQRLLTPEGEQSRYRWSECARSTFVREFSDEFERGAQGIFEPPKLDGLWVKLRYNDGETLEGVWVPNDLLSLLDNGLQSHSPT